MNTRQQVAAALLLALAAAAVLWRSGRRGGVPETVQGAVDGVVWASGYPEGNEHLARPQDIGTVIWGPHPIYCDPDGPGKYRDRLIARGWGWIADPPSEATI